MIPLSQNKDHNHEKNSTPSSEHIISNLSIFEISTTTSSSSPLLKNVLNFEDPEIFSSNFSSNDSFLLSKKSKVDFDNNKRNYSSFEIGCSSSLLSTTISTTCHLPTFISNVPENINNTPTPRLLTSEFATPLHQPKKHSRSNSPSSSTRLVSSRSRIASIRRESDCSVESEAAYEKLMKTAQQISLGFDEFCLDEKLFDERKRAKSLTEPISIFTNAFLPQSSSPSPTRNVDAQKQCYSPSTQQVVRSNISYSPSPSPTPSSPTRSRIMRSMSPIAVRQISKRRYTGSGNCSGLESDGESSLGITLPLKRQCTTQRSAASPLIRDPLNGFSNVANNNLIASQEVHSLSSTNSRSPTLFVSFTSTKLVPTNTSINILSGKPSRLHLHDSYNHQCCQSPGLIDLEETTGIVDEDQLPYQVYSFNDSSSTTFSSRTATPMEEPINETEMSSILNLSSSSSRSSYIRSESKSSLSNECIPSTSSIIINNSINNQITTCTLSFISFPSTVVSTNYHKEKSTLTFSSDYLVSSNNLNGISNSKFQLQQNNILPSRALQSTSSNSSPSFFFPTKMPTTTCTSQTFATVVSTIKSENTFSTVFLPSKQSPISSSIVKE